MVWWLRVRQRWKSGGYFKIDWLWCKGIRLSWKWFVDVFANSYRRDACMADVRINEKKYSFSMIFMQWCNTEGAWEHHKGAEIFHDMLPWYSCNVVILKVPEENTTKGLRYYTCFTAWYQEKLMPPHARYAKVHKNSRITRLSEGSSAGTSKGKEDSDSTHGALWSERWVSQLSFPHCGPYGPTSLEQNHCGVCSEICKHTAEWMTKNWYTRLW